MIDVDPKRGRADRSERCAESILNRGVERDDNIDLLRLGRRFAEQIRARKKTVFLEHAFFVPDAHVFAKLFERKPERELTAERVAIGPNVTQNGKPLMLVQRPADLLERGITHSRFSVSASICCRISTTREPRLIDSSR